MNQKYLIVKACAGIGNRIYTVSRAMQIAREQGRHLIVDWADGQLAPKGVNAFHYFFEIHNFLHQQNIPDLKGKTVYPPAWKEEINSAIYDKFYIVEPPFNFFKKIPLTFLPGIRLKRIHGYWMSTEIKNEKTIYGFIKNMFHKTSFSFGENYYRNRKEDVLVYVEFSPPFNEQLFLKHIKLKKQYLDKVDEFCRKEDLEKNSIGIHIRSTDKKPTREVDFLLQFIQKEEFKEKKIFLATDHKDTEAKFENILKEKVVVHSKYLPDTGGNGLHQFALYENKEELMLQMTEESLMDIWILSKCEKLFYQGNSSFSQVALTLKGNSSLCIDWTHLN